MVTDDLDCAAAAAELMGRRPGAVDPMVLACANSLLETQKALVALLPQVVDRFVDQPRRKRTIRLTYDEHGQPVIEEVTNQPEPAEIDPAQALTHPCPCCGGRMFVVETFEAGCKPRHRPTAPFMAIRIDTS
jgi:hypothetical protein